MREQRAPAGRALSRGHSTCKKALRLEHAGVRGAVGGRCDGSRAKEREQQKMRVRRQLCLAPWAFTGPQAFILGGAGAIAGSGGEESHRLSDLREGPLVAMLRRDCVRAGTEARRKGGTRSRLFP